MRPRWINEDKFRPVLLRKTERTFLVRRRVYQCEWSEGFALQDRDGNLWRPSRNKYLSDGGSIPHPLDWFIAALDTLRYSSATMGIHDPVYRHGKLALLAKGETKWRIVPVSRALGDSLLTQGIDASGGWRITQGAYWLGVRIPNCIASFFSK